LIFKPAPILAWHGISFTDYQYPDQIQFIGISIIKMFLKMLWQEFELNILL